MKSHILNLWLIVLITLMAISCKKEPQSPNLTGWSTPYSDPLIQKYLYIGVNALTEDNNGNIWFAYGGTLNKYDGTKF